MSGPSQQQQQPAVGYAATTTPSVPLDQPGGPSAPWGQPQQTWGGVGGSSLSPGGQPPYNPQYPGQQGSPAYPQQQQGGAAAYPSSSQPTWQQSSSAQGVPSYPPQQQQPAWNAGPQQPQQQSGPQGGLQGTSQQQQQQGGYPPYPGGPYPPQQQSGGGWNQQQPPYPQQQQGGYPPPQGGAPSQQWGAGPQQQQPQGGWGAPPVTGQPQQPAVGGGPFAASSTVYTKTTTYGPAPGTPYPPQPAPSTGAPWGGGLAPPSSSSLTTNFSATQGWLSYYGQPSSDEMMVLREWFSAVDQDGSGEIDMDELQRALAASGDNFDKQALDLMVSMFDDNGSGTIDISEFISLFRYINAIRQAFDFHDPRQTGSIDLAQVGDALGRANFQLPQATVQTLFFKFDKQKRGRINFAQFLEMAMYLGNLRTAFERQAFGQERLRLDLESFTALMATIYQPQP